MEKRRYRHTGRRRACTIVSNHSVIRGYDVPIPYTRREAGSKPGGDKMFLKNYDFYI